MTRPWLFTVRPFVLPTENREKLSVIAFGMTREQFADKIWRERDEAFGPVSQSRSDGWPMKITKPAKSNVTTLKAKTVAR